VTWTSVLGDIFTVTTLVTLGYGDIFKLYFDPEIKFVPTLHHPAVLSQTDSTGVVSK
jgi:hypothetical protein